MYSDMLCASVVLIIFLPLSVRLICQLPIANYTNYQRRGQPKSTVLPTFLRCFVKIARKVSSHLSKKFQATAMLTDLTNLTYSADASLVFGVVLGAIKGTLFV